MFTNISWQDFSIGVAITLIIYYVVVGLKYYPSELKELLTGRWFYKFKSPSAGSVPDEEALELIPTHHGDHPFHPQDEEFVQVESFISDLKETIARASAKGWIIQELKQALRRTMEKYPAVQSSPYRSSINELISSECEKSGYGDLTEEAVDRLWAMSL